MFVVALVVFDSMGFAQFEDELLLAVVGVVVVVDDDDDDGGIGVVAEAVVPWVSHLEQFGNRLSFIYIRSSIIKLTVKIQNIIRISKSSL